MRPYVEGVLVPPMRRIPARLSRTDEVSSHAKVAILGAIVALDGGIAVLADAAGQVEVALSEGQASVGDVVWVIGRVYGGTIEAEVVQPAKGVNIDLYNKSLPVLQKYAEL